MDLKSYKKLLFEHLRREIGDEQVIQVMEEIPREAFIPDSNSSDGRGS